MSEQELYEMALRAFALMGVDEQMRVLETFSCLRYPQVSDRFGEAVHREIMRNDTIRQQVHDYKSTPPSDAEGQP